MLLLWIICAHLCIIARSQTLVSRGKPTTQTSTWDKYKSSYCVDGNYKTMCHTQHTNSTSWMVDLTEEFHISHVILHNRADCCRERLEGVVIELLSKYDEVLYECGTVNETESSYKISCNSEFARKVRVRHAEYQILHFTELEVFGEPVTRNPVLISKGKPASQSSLSNNYYASKCVDGNYETSCRTLESNASSWTVDLQGKFSVNYVSIYSQGDNIQGLQGAVIELLSRSEQILYVCGTVLNESQSVFNISCNNRLASKVRVRHIEYRYVHFAELEVFGEPGQEVSSIISRRKPTYQSSVFESLSSSNCVDGDYNTICHTNRERPSFWVVDLQGKFVVDYVMIHNRNDYSAKRAIGALVELLSKNEEVLHTCGTAPGKHGPIYISCGHKLASKVRILHNRKQFVHFTEVDVHGVAVEPDVQIVSRRKPTSQSSVYQNHFGSVAVDGSYKEYLHDGKNYSQNCFLTKPDPMPFWTVDLKGTFLVDRVEIYNRMDCCTDRVVNSVVELLTKNGKVSHICGDIADARPVYSISCGNKLAQKVRIRAMKREYFNLCEVDVIGTQSKLSDTCNDANIEDQRNS